MFRNICITFIAILILTISGASAQDPALSFGDIEPTTTLPTGSGTPLGFGDSVPSGPVDPNSLPLDMGTPVPGSSSSTSSSSSSSSSGGSPKGGATAEEILQAISGYVVPTSTQNFRLSNVNSSNEANLIISSGNQENNVIFRIIRLIGMLVGTIAILLYIVAGYYMIFSMGDENALNKGKSIITFTTLGLVIAFGAYMIVQLVMGLIYFTS